MPPDTPKPAMQLIVEMLKDNPQTQYAEVKAAADARGLQVFPIMFGRAQAMLGIVKVAPRGSKKAKAETAESPAANLAGIVDTGSLEELVLGVRRSEQQRQRYRQALERIQQILEIAMRVESANTSDSHRIAQE